MAVYFVKNGFDSYTSIKAPARKFQQCNLWVQITFVFHVMFSNNVSLVKFSSVNSKASQGADQVEPWLDGDFRDPPGQTPGYGHSCNLPHAGEDQFTVVKGTTGGENQTAAQGSTVVAKESKPPNDT